MMARLISLGLVVALFAGCQPLSQIRGPAVVAGAATAIVGIALIKAGDVDADHDGVNFTIVDDNIDSKLGGALLVAIGVALAAAALGSPPATPPVAAALVPTPPVNTTPPTTVQVPLVAPRAWQQPAHGAVRSLAFDVP